jgi:hypothetical protein
MKLQYLGDSKDCFKWDYHDFLASALKVPTLDVIFMITPDDDGLDGATPPTLYRAKESIINFCYYIRECLKLGVFGMNRESDFYNRMKHLPQFTCANYNVVIHRQHQHFYYKVRSDYFSNLPCNNSKLVFIDPDNGFEPEKSCGNKHVSYNEINILLDQLPQDAVISVFHHFRRIPFVNDFKRIKERLGDCHATAIYWHSLMFVAVSKSKEAINNVIEINRDYSEYHPVKSI